MLCKIADLLTEVPETWGLVPRFQEYIVSEYFLPDIIISADQYRLDHYSKQTPMQMVAYMESAFQFYVALLEHHGLYLHASAVEIDGCAYLFSGASGIGKSTHTQWWKQVFGDRAQIINDDKPALRYFGDKWYAYGTPWCGKNDINQNRKAALAGICFLQQGIENKIVRLNEKEAFRKIITQTIRRSIHTESLDYLLEHIEHLVHHVPMYELINKPGVEAVQLSYTTMYREF